MKIFYMLLLVLFCLSCQRERIDETPQANIDPIDQKSEKGHLRIKLTKEAVEKLSVVETRSGKVSTGWQELDVLNERMKTYRMERTFRPAGKFEARHQKAGLHRWYDIYFDETVSTKSAKESLKAIPGIEVVEPVLIPQLVSEGMTFDANVIPTTTNEEDLPFNDPRLGEQWHYHNVGQVSPWLPEADINLFEAWNYETGSSDVIVAVLDKGVQVDHEDLAANMWVNEAELNGTPGVDDDNNGYVDDIYGYDFVQDKWGYGGSQILAEDHGTHVAGTIAAVNNNGIGVCGVAGGNGEELGVRIMSLRIIGTSGDFIPDAITYAADNGASIAQNSWTLGTDDSAPEIQSIREAFDYFIEYAGYDIDGNQNGPMAGGLVVVAASNNNHSQKEYPAAWESVVAVSAFAPDLKKAQYSNYGDWVDIAAPGGDINYAEQASMILSTASGNGYQWLQGTSMAAPHVSGVAALILSKFKGEGYTAHDLKARLLASVHDIDPYNPKYVGMLGVGYVDAAMALRGEPIPPEPAELKITASYDGTTYVEWTVSADADDGYTSSYLLSWRGIDASAPSGQKRYDAGNLNVGEIIRDTLRGLRLGVTYEYSLISYDCWKNASEPSIETYVVNHNFAPEIEPDWNGNVFIEEGEEVVLTCTLSDKEEHALVYELTPALTWVSTKLNGNILTITLAPSYGDAMSEIQEMKLTVADQYGASDVITIPYFVKRVIQPPLLLKSIADINVSVQGKQELNMLEYFSDLHGDELDFEIEVSDPEICDATVVNGLFSIQGKKVGSTVVLVRAINQDKQSVGCRLVVHVK